MIDIQSPKRSTQD